MNLLGGRSEIQEESIAQEGACEKKGFSARAQILAFFLKNEEFLMNEEENPDGDERNPGRQKSFLDYEPDASSEEVLPEHLRHPGRDMYGKDE